MRSNADAFLSREVLFYKVGTIEFAYRKFGAGEPMLLLHGWPWWGFTFRHVLPRLSAHYTCYVVDLPGAGDSRWQKATDFSFHGQAQSLAKLAAGIGLDRYHLFAHDTGGTIGRELAIIAGEPIQKIVLIDTEIPGHRPPWIPLYRKFVSLPGTRFTFRALMQSKAFRRSPLSFGNVFADKNRLGGEFEQYFIRPLIESPARLEGQLRYLQGIDWALVDSLSERHRQIKQPVLLIWGERDTIFPKDRAATMAPQFANCQGLKIVPGGKLFVHEEQPDIVCDYALEFLRAEQAHVN